MIMRVFAAEGTGVIGRRLVWRQGFKNEFG
jgi:hypothetical protein